MSSGITLPQPASLAELERRFGGSADPAARERSVRRVVAPAAAERDDDLVLVSSRRYLKEAGRAPGVKLCALELAAELEPGARWSHAHPLWALAGVLEPCVATPAAGQRALGAVVQAGASVAEDAVVAEGAVIERGARVGSGCVIGANAVIYGGVTLGSRVVVGPCAVVGRPGFGWATGPDGSVRRVPQLGGVIVEDDAEIGPLCTVDAGTLTPTRLGRGVKLDAHVHVAHNVELGDGCWVAAQVGFAGSAVLGPGVLVGGQAGFADHVRVGGHARIAAKSGVVGDIAARAVVAGFPAVAKQRWLRAMARLLRARES